MSGRINMLVIGSGAREHSIVWKLGQSDLLGDICCIPGNGGIADNAEIYDIPVDFKSVNGFIKEKNIGYVIIGPEAPLAAGMADYLSAEGVTVFGPSRRAAKLEGSKVYAKEFMKKYSIPTAPYEVFDTAAEALDHVAAMEESVIKADGLCAGKGVFVCSSPSEARDAVRKVMEQRIFEDAGNRIVVEEKLKGEEASILLLVSGTDYQIMLPSQDHKPAYDGDRGPNTGGMGAYAPASVVDGAAGIKIQKTIIEPVIDGLVREGISYFGVLYIGIMISAGDPNVLEFNVRFGDPETEVLLPLMEDDLFKVILDLENGSKTDIRWKKGSCVDVVLASGGYPGSYVKGKKITIERDLPDEVMLFHAGTRLTDDGLVTAGGRVLNVTALGADINDARNKAYNAVSKISFEGMHYRKDIGLKEVER
ncbi:phosphoribosylamine--glycine ligase [Elusimicrobiota bacterium]